MLSICQKFEDIDSVSVGMVHKALEDIVQSVFEQAISSPSVPEHRYRFDVFADIDFYEIVPDVHDRYDGKEIGLCDR